MEIAMAMEYPALTHESAGELVSALRDTGWMDGDQLHDWEEHAGWLIERRESDAERKRVLRTSSGRLSDGVRTACVEERRGEEIRGEESKPEVPPASEDSKPKAASKRFLKPTPDQVETYAAKIGYSKPGLGQRFVDFYESKGWKVGNSPMKSWEATVRTWRARDAAGGGNGGRTPARTSIPTAKDALKLIADQTKAVADGFFAPGKDL